MKPEPTVVIMVRAPSWLHESVKAKAEANQMSINSYCKRVLAKAVGHERAKQFDVFGDNR